MSIDPQQEPYIGASEAFPAGKARWRQQLHRVIFGVDTPAGRAFDVILLWAIMLSVACVVLESVESIRAQYGNLLRAAEWFFTGTFLIEYLLRLMTTATPWRYARSFFGLIDLFSILPTPLSLVIESSQSLLVIRAVRLLRVFRIFKMVHFVGEADVLISALHASRRRIAVFVGAVLSIALIMGALMYVIEGSASNFTSIPQAVYWAIVTMTTVGFGDITPVTPFGKLAASILMIMGYGIIAIPTGIVTVEIGRASAGRVTGSPCRACGFAGHQLRAKYCSECGTGLLTQPQAGSVPAE